MASKKAKKTPPKRGSASLVLPARGIPESTRCMLWGLAGGHCEFSGCNRRLLEHDVTSLRVNLAEAAHIVAFSKRGPRGKESRPDDVHALENLMLLCPGCHKIIDDREDDFTRPMLEGYKRTHEERVAHLMSLSPDMKTTVVQLKALVVGKPVDIPVSHVYEAVSPHWPSTRTGHVIDVSQYSTECENGPGMAATKIDAETAALYRPGMDAERTGHISLFALGPIPVLMHLGSRLSDKMPVSFFQRHRDNPTSPWTWPDDSPPVSYAERTMQRGTDASKVALVLSLSGTVSRAALPASIDETFTVYEISLDGQPPTPDFLRNRADLERFRKLYRARLAEVVRVHGHIASMHVFAAVPAPIAVVLGHDVLPKAQPTLLAHEFDREAGGFVYRLPVGRMT